MGNSGGNKEIDKETITINQEERMVVVEIRRSGQILGTFKNHNYGIC